MLGQGCIRALFGELFICTSSGFKMGFGQWAEMGPKVGQKWVFGCKSGSKRQNPLFHPLKTHFGIFTKTYFLPSLRGVEVVFQRPLRQSRPSKTIAVRRGSYKSIFPEEACWVKPEAQTQLISSNSSHLTSSAPSLQPLAPLMPIGPILAAQVCPREGPRA